MGISILGGLIGFGGAFFALFLIRAGLMGIIRKKQETYRTSSLNEKIAGKYTKSRNSPLSFCFL
jgi:hypothetical protein